MNMKRKLVIFTLLLATSPIVTAAAQRANPPRRPAQGVAPRARAENRAVLERRVRQAFTRAVRQRVGLDTGQMRRLGDVTRRYDGERRALLREERQTRSALRRGMQSGTPDQASLERGWKRLQELQRRRLDLNEREDRDLSAFMTPLQRTRYHALQEQVRRRLEELRRTHRENQLSDDSLPGAVPR